MWCGEYSIKLFYPFAKLESLIQFLHNVDIHTVHKCCLAIDFSVL